MTCFRPMSTSWSARSSRFWVVNPLVRYIHMIIARFPMYRILHYQDPICNIHVRGYGGLSPNPRPKLEWYSINDCKNEIKLNLVSPWTCMVTLDLTFLGVDSRVAQFCQKFKIQKVIPLRCWIGSNGFQKVQKLENLCMLKTAPTHFFVYEVILLKKIFRHICFCLKTILPKLKTFWPL